MQNEIRYFSMFSGVGGFELGLERASNSKPLSKIEQDRERRNRTTNEPGTLLCSGQKPTFRCVGFSEIDKYSIQTYQKNFPNHTNFGDCTTIKPRELPDFDMLCGGFPCQSFSIAGKRRGFEDTRGTMFFEIARILEVKRPKLILLENVKGLLNHDKGKTFSVIIQALEELGYRTQWMVLNSKFFGVPQNRERVFIIGSLRGGCRPEILPFGFDYKEIDKQRITHPTITEAIGRQGSSKEYIRSCETILLSAKTGARQVEQSNCLDTMYHKGLGSNQERPAIAVLTPDRPEKRQNGRRFKEPGEPSFTLTGQDIHGVAIMDLYNNKEHTDRSPALTEPHHNTLRVRENMKIRRLTPIECERLQGFPDNWTSGVSDTQRYKQMGNAVTVNVIAAIGEALSQTHRNN